MLYLEVYQQSKENKWTQLVLKTLISYTELPNGLTHETKLAVALSVLEHIAITPYLRRQSEAKRDALKTSLNEDMVKAAEKLAKEKSPELWAEELLK